MQNGHWYSPNSTRVTGAESGPSVGLFSIGTVTRSAEAAQCARDQQKFWEYQDLLFQDTQRLAKADLLAYAGQVKLDTKQFQDCLESGKHAPDVERDYQAGVTLGVSGTPTFFINGRLLTGGQPLAAFTAVIDSELSTTPAPTGAS